MAKSATMPVDLFSHRWWRHIGSEALEKAMLVIGILILTAIIRALLWRVINVSVTPPWMRDRMPEHQKARLETVKAILKNIATYILVFVAGVQTLKVIGGAGYDITPIITTAGVTGIAIGFGAQKLVRDAISGFFILLEDQYAVGDYVTVNDTTGTIESVGMRITQLRDEQGRLTTISNGDVAKVINFSRGIFESWVEIGVAASVNLETITKVLEDACSHLAIEGLSEAPSYEGVVSFDAAKVVLRVNFKARPADQLDIQMILRERLRQALIAAEIQPA